MAKNAKDYAKEQLGDLDLSYLDTEREVANRNYDTSKSSLENSYNNLLEQINANRGDTRKNFNTGRTTVAENAFNANRTNKADLASRGVGTGGLQELGEVGNRMETGKQYSKLANEFYDTMGELETTEKQGKSQYDIDQKTIKNTLDSSLSGIDTRGKEAQNAYNMTLGQLAEAVQGRWDSNANAEAALAQARAAAAQAHQDAINSANAQLKSAKQQQLLGYVNDKNLSQDAKVNRIASTFGVDPILARNLLVEMGVYDKTPNTGYTKGSDYYGQLTGGW